MTALLREDFVWQLNVPLSPVVRGREGANTALQQQAGISSGRSRAAGSARSCLLMFDQLEA